MFNYISIIVACISVVMTVLTFLYARRREKKDEMVGIHQKIAKIETDVEVIKIKIDHEADVTQMFEKLNVRVESIYQHLKE